MTGLTVNEWPDFYLSITLDKDSYEKAKKALLKLGNDYGLEKEGEK